MAPRGSRRVLTLEIADDGFALAVEPEQLLHPALGLIEARLRHTGQAYAFLEEQEGSLER
jgi:hypothetical protein